jgi:hypothetical protein
MNNDQMTVRDLKQLLEQYNNHTKIAFWIEEGRFGVKGAELVEIKQDFGKVFFRVRDKHDEYDDE